MRFSPLLALALATPLVLAQPLAAQPATPAPPPHERATVTVIGESEIRAAPDIATVSAGVVSDADTAADAVRANNQAVAQVVASLRGAEIDPRDLQTSGFNVEPRYVYPTNGQGEPRIVGYRASNTLAVTVRDLDRLGEILDSVVGAGANQISGLAFDIANAAEMLDRARAEAVRDARRKAEVYAEAAGVSLGEVVIIDERTDQAPPPMPFRSMAADRAEAASVPIEIGEQVLRAQVRVVWSIAPRP